MSTWKFSPKFIQKFGEEEHRDPDASALRGQTYIIIVNFSFVYFMLSVGSKFVSFQLC